MNAKRFQDTLISANASIIDALRIIDNASLQIALVIDEEKRLVGTITDGDIRRAILSGVRLEDTVTMVMNKSPLAVTVGASDEEMLHLMMEKKVYRLPVIDRERRVIGLRQIDELIKEEQPFAHIDPADVWVVLMLGGQGERLRPLTNKTPKPMIDIGGRPLLETIVRNFVGQGFKRLFFSVNYKADIIREHFGDGAAFGAQITYVAEKEKMGTAGSLSLLPERPEKPFIIMNGDILTNSNFAHLLDFHAQNHARATMCVREYQYQVPYGVVQTVGTRLDSIVEKPWHTYFTNAGIYILDPAVLDFVPSGAYFDMPQLFETLAEKKMSSTVFPIREYWLDIGSFEDLEQARKDYQKIFKG